MERLNGPLVFVTGQDGNEITEENIKHGDILQLDFHDSYQNLTMKMMGMKRDLKIIFFILQYKLNTQFIRYISLLHRTY